MGVRDAGVLFSKGVADDPPRRLSAAPLLWRGIARAGIFTLCLMPCSLYSATTVLVTEDFVLGGLATKTSPAEVASAIATAVGTKQDALPTAVGNEGKILGVTDSFGALGWIEQSDTDISGKADLQSGDTVGNVATMDGSGQYIDSGTALSALATTSSVSTALDGCATIIYVDDTLGDISEVLYNIRGE